MRKLQFIFTVVVVAVVLSLKVFAADTVILTPINAIDRASAPNQKLSANLIELPFSRLEIPQHLYQGSDESMQLDGPQGVIETYTTAPLGIRADNTGSYLPFAPAVTTQFFTDSFSDVESGGLNQTGSVSGQSKFEVRESLSDMGGGVNRYLVEMRATNATGTPEAWISSEFSNNNFVTWRLDIGSSSGGTDPINPGFPFAVVNSAANGYSTTDAPIGTPEFYDTSTSSGLSGVVFVDNGGNNIAGVALARIEMFWDIVASPDVEILSIDATDGAYLQGSTVYVIFPMRNNGSTSSGTTGRLRVYASTDSSISAADRELAVYVPDLDAGETVNYGADVPIPADLANGEYYIGAILDYPDPDQSNNSAVDLTPILVSDQPEIHIQPSSLQFTESHQLAAMNSEIRQSGTGTMAWSQTQLPAMLEAANKEGSVRVIVGFDAGSIAEGSLSETEQLDQRQAINDMGATLLSSLQGMSYQENARYQFIPYMGLSVDASALQALAVSPLVTSIELDALSAPHLNSSNPVIGSAAAWADGFDGNGQTIAVIDTGVDISHPWFTTGGNKVVTEACYSSNETDSTSVCPGGVEDSVAAGSGVHCSSEVSGCDHGTHVAGIAAGNPGTGTLFGVARGANIAAMQVFSRIDSTESCGSRQSPCALSYTSDQIKALERVYALRETIDFASVNMSLGGGQYFNSGDCDNANPSRKAAIDNLRSVGIATVISSGNDSYLDSISAPGCISSAVSVGNTTDADNVAGSSNIYPEIDLLAPGSSITSAVPGTGTGIKTGTSMAAPHVAGAWAILKQSSPEASVSAVLNALQATGTAVSDQRNGGIEVDMPRINVDLALGDARASFSILNQGTVALNIASITRETAAPWITWSPQAPFSVQPGELQVVNVLVDFDAAPAGATQSRLLVNSNDVNESPYPGAVLVNVTTLQEPGKIIVDKVTNPGASSQSFDFTLTGAGVNQSFALTDAASPYDSGALLPTSENGTYNVSESMPADWSGSGTCSNGSSPTAVTLDPGEIVTCIFTNTLEQTELIHEDGFEAQ